jgi:repressor LexA
MPTPLTTLEREILDYLVEYVRAHTYQPSIREIGARFHIKSTKTVSELLQSLADKGWVERDPSRSRGVRLLGLELRADVVSVPHIDVHLSNPVLRDPIDNLSLDRRIVGSSACFMISMVGDSMRDSGIWDGDLLLVEPVTLSELDDGDLTVARLAGETGVRRFVRRGEDGLLDGGHIDLPPTVLTGRSAAEVLGRVVAVLRRLRTDAPAGLVPEERTAEGAIAT